MRIFNLGSINVDHLYQVNRLPEPGETLSSRGYLVNMGGKGLNISVAAHRSGADVRHVGLVGAGDHSVREMISDLGLGDQLIKDVQAPTGHAIIYLDDQSENCIVIHGGANHCFSEETIRSSLCHAKANDWLVIQNETNANEIGIRVARDLGMKIALVAAPFDAATMPAQIERVDLVSMNQAEKELFEASVSKSVKAIEGPEFLITYGKSGATFLSGATEIHLDSHCVDALDTTGAGDTFFGVFLANYVSGMSPDISLERANAAGALMVQRKGAASVIPTKADIDAFLRALRP